MLNSWYSPPNLNKEKYMKPNRSHGETSLTTAFFCAAVYFCSYLTRKDFAIALVAITEATGFSDASIAAVPVCLFIAYGLGQTVNGAIGDRVPPQHLITAGMLISAVCNIMLPFCPSVPAMCVVWGMNGFAQAMLWPPMSKILICTYSGRQYGTASMIVSVAASLATTAGYLYIPAILAVSQWKAVFEFGAGIVLVCAAAWFFYSFRKDFVSGASADIPPAGDNIGSRRFPSGAVFALAIVLIDVVIVGMLRDGIETWTPTYIRDCFSLPAEMSILVSVLLALFSAVCIVATTYIYRRFFKNELSFCCAVFALAGAVAVVLYFAGGNIVLSTVCISLLAALMHGPNLALTAYAPHTMKRFGHISTVSGVINSAIYVGAAISTYAIAGIKESSGWSSTIFFWISLCICGALLSAICARLWKRNVMR